MSRGSFRFALRFKVSDGFRNSKCFLQFCIQHLKTPFTPTPLEGKISGPRWVWHPYSQSVYTSKHSKAQRADAPRQKTRSEDTRARKTRRDDRRRVLAHAERHVVVVAADVCAVQVREDPRVLRRCLLDSLRPAHGLRSWTSEGSTRADSKL